MTKFLKIDFAKANFNTVVFTVWLHYRLPNIRHPFSNLHGAIYSFNAILSIWLDFNVIDAENGKAIFSHKP